jgi:hypothetical protein
MNIIQQVVNPYGAGLAVAVTLLLLLTALWLWKVAFASFHWLLLLGSVMFAAWAVVAAVFALVLPHELSARPTAAYDAVTQAGVAVMLGCIGYAACVVGSIVVMWAKLSTVFGRPWRQPRVMLTSAVAVAAGCVAQQYVWHAEMYWAWSEDRRPISWSVWVALLWYSLMWGVVFAAAVSFIRTGLELPEVRAKWERRLDAALEGLSYSGWSNMPYAAPFLPQPPESWRRKRSGDSLDGPGEDLPEPADHERPQEDE